MRNARRPILPALAILLALIADGAPPGGARAGGAPEARIEAVLDDFHAAASAADEERYFGHLAAGAVFLGTDATERWTKEQFRAYAHPHFARGQGWTYRASERHVTLAADGETAWFDERLDNAKYGECRGTGVLQRHGGVWKIEQYNLTIPVPNALAGDLVEKIREHEERTRGEETSVVGGDRKG